MAVSLSQTISLINAPENIPILEIPHQDKLCFISFAAEASASQFNILWNHTDGF